MAPTSAEIVICGAGIAGIATAYSLAIEQGLRDITLIEQEAPLALTSDKSTECYRNWWPGPDDAMIALMNRSIDLLEHIAQTNDNCIHLNRRGYLYATADETHIPTLLHTAHTAAHQGAGPLRIHGSPHANISTPLPNTTHTYSPAPAHGFEHQPDGADLILDPTLIRAHFPYLADTTRAVLHTRRGGWFSAQQLGMHMLERARDHGVRLIRGRLISVDTTGERVCAVHIAHDTGALTTIVTPHLVNAAGPFQRDIGHMLGVDIPVFCERHLKVAINDHLGIIPRDAPLLIWNDETHLPWNPDERTILADEQPELLARLPAGAHCRPEGQGTNLLLLWNNHREPIEPTYPIANEPHYPELALRAMTVMIPGLARYLERPPRPAIDGGYYIKTRENRPLIGPLPITGASIIGALSGFGIMAACAAGELLATHIVGAPLPPYAPAFDLARYDRPDYQNHLATWGDSGQL